MNDIEEIKNYLKNIKGKSTITVAFYISRTGMTFHVLEWMNKLCKLFIEKNFCVIFIADINILTEKIEFGEKVFYLTDRDLLNIDFIDYIITLDFEHKSFNKKAFVISFPHASIINYSNTIYESINQMLLYDAVVIPFPNKFNKKNVNTYWKECIPYNLMRREKFYFIELFYPKKFFLAQEIKRDVKLDAIIYAPRPLCFSSDIAIQKRIENEENLLKSLLNNFPEYYIIYRPYNTDIKENIYIKTTKNLSKFKNFYTSISENYEELFSRALTLVTDTSSIANTFSESTYRKVIYFRPWEGNTQSTESSIILNTINDLLSYVESLKKELNTVFEKNKNDNIYEGIYSLNNFVSSLYSLKYNKLNFENWHLIDRSQNNKNLKDFYIKNALTIENKAIKIFYIISVIKIFPEDRILYYILMYLYISYKDFSSRETILILMRIYEILPLEFYKKNISTKDIKTHILNYIDVSKNSNIYILLKKLFEEPIDEKTTFKYRITNTNIEDIHNISNDNLLNFRFNELRFFLRMKDNNLAYLSFKKFCDIDNYDEDFSLSVINLAINNNLFNEEIINTKLFINSSYIKKFFLSNYFKYIQKKDKAIEYAKKCIIEKERDLNAFINLIKIYKYFNELQEVQNILNDVFIKFKNNQNMYIEISNIYNQLKQLPKAEKILLEGLQYFSFSENIIISLCEFYSSTNRYKKLDELLSKYSDKFNECGWFYHYSAIAKSIELDHSKAIFLFKKSIYYNKFNIKFKKVFAFYLFKNKFFEELKKQLENFSLAGIQDDWIYLLYSKIYDQEILYDLSLYYIYKALEINTSQQNIAYFTALMLKRNYNSNSIKISSCNLRTAVSDYLKELKISTVDINEYLIFTQENFNEIYDYILMMNNIYDFHIKKNIKLPLSQFYLSGKIFGKNQFIKFNSDDENTILYGPYIDLPTGSYLITMDYSFVVFDICKDKEVKSFLDITNNNKLCLFLDTFSPGINISKKISISSQIPIKRIEIRSHILDKCVFHLDSISISAC